VRRPLTGLDPDDAAGMAAWFFGLFDLAPFDGHVHLCGSPLYHTAVLNFATISLQLGHPVVLMDRWDPEESLRLTQAHRVTHTHTVPTQFRRLLALPDEVRARYDTSSLRAVIHSAAPCPAEVKRRMIDWLGPVIVEYYAATEGGGTLINARQWLSKPGSVGLPWKGSVIKVLDRAGHEVPTGEQGLVYMRMGTSSFSYHQDEEKTRAARAGELFTVGDIGYLDADGYLFLAGRSDDVINRGGEKIYPREIEEILLAQPGVHAAAVIGLTDEVLGERPVAYVVPEPGAAAAAVEEVLRAACAQRLPRHKQPSEFWLVDEMPLGPTGKISRRLLKESVAAPS